MQNTRALSIHLTNFKGSFKLHKYLEDNMEWYVMGEVSLIP